ncbi:hypothetical protein MRX96_014998 [Rhipicephalus microplus]
MKVRPTRIIQKLKKETGKVIIAKDVHTMRTNNNRGNGTEKLLQMISGLCEKEQATVIPITDESQELQLLYVQTRQMHRMFEGYPEVLFLDATYRTSIECPCLFSWSRMVRAAAM